MGNLATGKLVTNWYQARRGSMLGIASMGISASGLLMPLITAWLINAFGWRQVFVIFALVLWLVILPFVWHFVKGDPADIGQHPYGATTDPQTQAQPVVVRTALWRDQRFWGVALVFGLMLSAVAAVLTHLVPIVVDMGFSLEKAAPMLSCTAGVAILGKFLLGNISDRVGPHRAVICAISALTLGLWLLRDATTYQEGLIAVSIFGLGMGGVVPLQAALVGDIFGGNRFGEVMGWMRPVMMPLAIIGVPLAGWVFDTTGSYTGAFNIFLGGFCLAAVLLFVLSGRHQGKRAVP